MNITFNLFIPFMCVDIDVQWKDGASETRTGTSAAT